MCGENKMKKVNRNDRVARGSYRLLAKHIKVDLQSNNPMRDSLMMLMQMQDGTRMRIFLPDRRFDIMTMRWL